MSFSRSVNRPKASRTQHAYSRGDHHSGEVRRATSSRVRTWRHEATRPRIQAGTSSRATERASNPHSAQGGSSTQVQSLSSGTMAMGAKATVGRVLPTGPPAATTGVRAMLSLVSAGGVPTYPVTGSAGGCGPIVVALRPPLATYTAGGYHDPGVRRCAAHGHAGRHRRVAARAPRGARAQQPTDQGRAPGRLAGRRGARPPDGGWSAVDQSDGDRRRRAPGGLYHPGRHADRGRRVGNARRAVVAVVHGGRRRPRPAARVTAGRHQDRAPVSARTAPP